MIRWYIILLWFLFGNLSFAQKLHQTTSESTVLIGQPFSVTYSAKIDMDDSVQFHPKSDVFTVRSSASNSTLSSKGVDFEISDEFTDTFVVRNKVKEWIGEYIVTAWDSGGYILPGPTIVINDSTYQFKDLKINCVLTDPIDGIDLYDIKENYADVPEKPFSILQFLKDNWWWLSIILVALAIYIYIKRRSKEEEEEIDHPTSLKERTLIAIEALDKSKLWERDELKRHFTELSFILRSYLTSRYNISLLEKTTHQSRILLKQKGLNEDTVDVIIRILFQSDMVKFAKSKPEVIEILKISTLAKQVVVETSPLDFDNVE